MAHSVLWTTRQAVMQTPPHVESLFIPDKKRSKNYVFQTFLYAAIMCRKQPTMKIAPALLYIHRAATETYSPVIQMGEPRKPKEAVEDFSKYEKEYRERLQGLLEEIFNPEKIIYPNRNHRKMYLL